MCLKLLKLREIYLKFVFQASRTAMLVCAILRNCKEPIVAYNVRRAIRPIDLHVQNVIFFYILKVKDVLAPTCCR